MNPETETGAPETATRRCFWSLRAALLGVALTLVGVCAYVVIPASSSAIQVNGQLSAADAAAIRQGVARWRNRTLVYAITHLRFGMFWDHIRVSRTCPLVSIASYDGNTGSAVCKGRTWTGNQISVVYMFTNNAGVWSGTTVTTSEKK